MPHLLFRGIAAEKLHAVCEPLAGELAEICRTGTDNFTMEISNGTTLWGCEVETKGYIFVEIAWFERGQETRDAVAQAVTRHLLKLGEADIEVAFRTYREDSYYVNGQSFEEQR
ncbi:DUF1904 family protein [Paenibacillus thailandensis]|uniref:DUF1904 family protein n=1 Tax=Paenibacillus thailandensis TaxID=393250 RepID=A0ABW5QYH0_9BACL